MVDRITELENQVYNLTLYLHYVQEHDITLWERMMEHFDGMGGYGKFDSTELDNEVSL